MLSGIIGEPYTCLLDAVLVGVKDIEHRYADVSCHKKDRHKNERTPNDPTFASAPDALAGFCNLLRHGQDLS